MDAAVALAPPTEKVNDESFGEMERNRLYHRLSVFKSRNDHNKQNQFVELDDDLHNLF